MKTPVIHTVVSTMSIPVIPAVELVYPKTRDDKSLYVSEKFSNDVNQIT